MWGLLVIGLVWFWCCFFAEIIRNVRELERNKREKSNATHKV